MHVIVITNKDVTLQYLCCHLQALRAVSHNYPSIMFSCWEQISTIVYNLLRAATPEVHVGQWKGHTGNSVGFVGEKIITAAIRVRVLCCF